MNYHKIDTCNMNNGDGLRVVLWVSGCNHYCDGCFNKETWDVSNGDLIGEKQIEMINGNLSKEWCSGITFTGGDPLHQSNVPDIKKLCINIKKQYPQKTIWIYTGFTYEELKSTRNEDIDIILSIIDILVDGKYRKNLNSPEQQWAGSTNQRVIDVQETLKSNEIILWTNK